MDGNQSVMSGVTDVSGWGGPMGGGAGDGIPQQQQQMPPPPSNVYAGGAAAGGLNQMPPQQQQQYQQPQMSGSVTQFAPQQQQQQPQMFSPAPPQSYAARSQQMYGTGGTPQQQQPTPGSFMARSQQAYGSQAMQSSPPQGPSSTAGYSQTSAMQSPTMQHRQQQQYQQQPTTQSNVYGSNASMNDTYSTASFSARSQQVYSSPQRPMPAQTVVSTLYGQHQQLQSPPQAAPPVVGLESTHQQQRLLTEATKKVQEHSYYMKQAIEQQNLSLALDRAAHMVGELGGPPHGQQSVSSNTGNAAKLTPKSYYELYMRALEDMPTFQDYLIALVKQPPPQQPQPNSMVQQSPGGMYQSGMQSPGMYQPGMQSPGMYQPGMQNPGMYGNAMPNQDMQSPGMQNPLMQSQPGVHSPMQNPGMPGMQYPTMQNPGMGMQSPGMQAPGNNTMNRYGDTAVAARKPPSMRELYDTIQFYPRVVSRLYLQIAAGSALIQSGECGANWVMTELQQAVKCEQNPVRGLFVRNFLLTALRDKLPDTVPTESETPSNGGGDEGETKDDDSASGGHGHTAIQDIKEVDESDKGNVRDSVDFILSNFMEMNKLWVRIQHLPGEGRNKDVRKRRERERNDLRLLIGNNMMRLSQLDCVTSKIYGEVILPKILDHVVVAGDPLSQAYTMDCLVQVFPDEYHIETLPILLSVCPRLRDKVNIRTILQGLMDRLANYLLEEELLDESDTNQVKREIARDAFGLFEDCVQNVYNARGPKLSSKEVIRLQTALLQFSIKCYPGSMSQVSNCINNCVSALRQANASYEVTAEGTVATNVPSAIRPLDPVSTSELGELLSIPLDSFALKVLELEQYGGLIAFLPQSNQREVAKTMLNAVAKNGSPPQSVHEIDQLFRVVECLVSDEHTTQFGQQTTSVDMDVVSEENKLVAQLIHQLDHESSDIHYEMLQVAKTRILNEHTGPHRWAKTLVSIVYAALRLARRVAQSTQAGTFHHAEQISTEDKEPPNVEETLPSEEGKETLPSEEGKETLSSEEGEGGPEKLDKDDASPNSDVSAEALPKEQNEDIGEKTSVEAMQNQTSSRAIFAFAQETILKIGEVNVDLMLKLSLDSCLAADACVSIRPENESNDCGPVVLEFLNQSCDILENNSFDPAAQVRSIYAIAGTLQQLESIDGEVYAAITPKVAQFAARVMEKPQQCKLIAVCAHLFYPVNAGLQDKYNNAQRSLECLQRCLKLADACTSLNSSHVTLFVDLLENYVYFFEAKNPLVTAAYISGLLALIKEHLTSAEAVGGTRDAKVHYAALLTYIRERKVDPETAEAFAAVEIGE